MKIKQGQHCTRRRCSFTFAHTGKWCGYEQRRPCKCPFCYPKAKWNRESG